METTILEYLFKNQDEKYADFQSKLTPTVDRSLFIGVRTPILRSLAKEIYSTPKADEFLKSLPHKYYEENNLHAFLLERIKDYPTAIKAVEEFLPFVDNWATCDQMCLSIFKKNTDKLLPKISEWLLSNKTYTVRFGVGCLMGFYLDDKFKASQLILVRDVKSDEYYINMMRAWYFATALAKQWESTIPIIEEKSLDIFTHNKTIRKAIESNRITDEQKAYLRTLSV